MEDDPSTKDHVLTHLGDDGAARMVDVGDKKSTKRVAVASGRISMSSDTLSMILAGNMKKGDVMSTARVAGIMAAKRTSDLVPLCHPLPLNKVEIVISPDLNGKALIVSASVSTDGKTGVEMEALTAASITCLTIYDMAKAVQKDMVIGPVQLESKTGGVSGDYKRDV
ncbi:MAG: cyclic pyranopterin monophosphate synthase MoaC [Pseudomonadota bacterium]